MKWIRRHAIALGLVGTGVLVAWSALVPGMANAVGFAGWAIASTVLMTPIPQEPVIFYAATLWHPLVVALAMTAASCVSAWIDYTVLSRLNSSVGEALSLGRWSGRVASWFLTTPFPTLVMINLLPIPLSPFKLLCIASGYPLARFELALVLGRGPRYFLLAWLGKSLDLSLSYVILLALILVAAGQLHRRKLRLPRLETRHD